VGICEQHAVTFAAGLAREGFKPVVAIYSTFLQRSYDQIVHDVCLQGLPVTFCLDRGGLVGEDGATHHGLFDLSYLRHIPNMSVIVPRDENMLQHAIITGLSHNGPAAVRYPRGRGTGAVLEDPGILPWGRGELLKPGRDVAILALGSMNKAALEAAELLEKRGIHAAVIDPVFVKPLDGELLLRAASFARYGFVTVEENVLAGGFGSAVQEFLTANKLYHVPVRMLGVPDRFVEHGARNILLQDLGLLPADIAAACLELAGHGGSKRSWVQGGNE